LKHVRHLVREKLKALGAVRAIGTRSEKDVGASGEGSGVLPPDGGGSGLIAMKSNRGEVGTKTSLKSVAFRRS
jgi:hypothetical protein